MQRGTQLLAKAKVLGDVSKSLLMGSCVHVSNKDDGSEAGQGFSSATPPWVSAWATGLERIPRVQLQPLPPRRAMNSTLNGIVYVSVWVMLWGTAASLADAVLLERSAYEAGSSGQVITFASYGIAAVVLAVKLSGRFLRQQD